MNIKEQLKKSKDKYKILFNEDKLSSHSFERKNIEIEKWASEKERKIEDKKNNYLCVFGNLSDFASIINSKNPPVERRSSNKSLTDIDYKFSDNFSHSELSQKQDKVGNYMNNESRNYLKDRRHISMASVDAKNKSIDKLNQSKEIERVSDRMSKFEILNQDKEQSFSHKGPVIVTDHIKHLSDEANKAETGRKSEILKHVNPDDFDLEECKKSKSGDFLPFLESKNIDADNTEIPEKEMNNKLHDYDELVGYPSDDEDSKRTKEQNIEQMISDKSISNKPDTSIKSIAEFESKDETHKSHQDEHNDKVTTSNKSKYEEFRQNNLKMDDEDWPSGFPSIADNKTINHDEVKTERKICSNYELLSDICKNPHNELDSLCDDNLLCNLSKEENFGDTGDKRIEDAEELFYSSNEKNYVDQESIIVDSNLIEKQEEDHDGHISPINDVEVPAFPQQESEINKMFNLTEAIKEDTIPSKPTTLCDKLDLEKMPASNTLDTEKESCERTKCSDLSSPLLSLNDIMKEDLIGNSKNQSKKKSRTEDDLLSKNKQKDDKAASLADDILFCLLAECRANMFPHRVNPNKLKLKTEEEIAKFEQEKATKEEKSKEQAIIDKKLEEELRESLQDDSPQSRMAIKTDSATVMNYMKVLFNKITGKEVDFIMNLSTPLKRNELEILMHLQNTHYELESHEMLPYQQSVLTVDIYLDIERTRKKEEEQILSVQRQKARDEHEKKKAEQEEQKKNDPLNSAKREEMKTKLMKQLAEDPDDDEAFKENDESSDSDNASEFTKEEEINTKLFNLKCEWENIHNKVIFDAVNESLDGLRPYGLKGPPLPWSKQQRTLIYKNCDLSQIPRILESVQKKVVSWAKTYAGTMNFSELLREYKIPYLEDDQLNQVREERLAIMLANEIEENEPLWTDYEYEETQAKIELSDMIFNYLIDETALLANKIGNNSN